MPIRIDCYLGYENQVLNGFKKKYPEAIFEIITRTNYHVLAPSKELLIEAGIFRNSKGKKNPLMDPREYRRLFINEIIKNPRAIEKIRQLEELSKEKTIFLVCYEKDPSKCHRSIVKEIIENSRIWF